MVIVTLVSQQIKPDNTKPKQTISTKPKQTISNGTIPNQAKPYHTIPHTNNVDVILHYSQLCSFRYFWRVVGVGNN